MPRVHDAVSVALDEQRFSCAVITAKKMQQRDFVVHRRAFGDGDVLRVPRRSTKCTRVKLRHAPEEIWQLSNVVLAFHSGAGCVQPFATWIVRPGGVCIWGHYFESVFDAVADYAERS